MGSKNYSGFLSFRFNPFGGLVKCFLWSLHIDNGLMEIYSTISTEAIQSISKATAWEHKIVPFNVTDSYIDVYCVNEAIDFAEEQELLTGQSINFNFVEESQLDGLLGKFYPKNQDERAKVKIYDKEGDEFLEDGIRKLVLKNGQRYTGTPGTGNFQVMKYDIHEVKLLNTTPDFSVNYRMKGLYDLISDKNAALASAEIQWRLFAPISVIILVLFAFVLGDVAPRQNKYSNILYAIIIYFIYSNLIIVSINGIQKNTLFFSIFGTWWVHAFAILICLILFKNNKNQILNFSYIKNRIENLKHKL